MCECVRWKFTFAEVKTDSVVLISLLLDDNLGKFDTVKKRI